MCRNVTIFLIDLNTNIIVSYALRNSQIISKYYPTINLEGTINYNIDQLWCPNGGNVNILGTCHLILVEESGNVG